MAKDGDSSGKPKVRGAALKNVECAEGIRPFHPNDDDPQRCAASGTG
jgi:hypothetical protein